MLHVSPESVDTRRARILDAAEACFVRAGFHRTTMQDVAAEAGMSAGNLYRYFESKDSIVEGLCGRDRRELAADFAELGPNGDGFLDTLLELGRRHLADSPRDKAVLTLQIWAEAARETAAGRLAAEFDAEVSGGLALLLEAAREAGQVPADLDAAAAAKLIATVADGVLVRRAVAPGFEADREVGQALQLIRAVASGAVPGLCRRAVAFEDTLS